MLPVFKLHVRARDYWLSKEFESKHVYRNDSELKNSNLIYYSKQFEKINARIHRNLKTNNKNGVTRNPE